jgi:hypothetical protein
LVIVRLVFSQCVLLPTSGSLLVKLTSHDTVLVVDTLVVEFVVTRVAGEAASVSVNVSASRRTDPLVAPQLSPEYSVNDSVPLRFVPPVDVTVAESFGSQFCADVVPVVSFTWKHSPVVASLEPV